MDNFVDTVTTFRPTHTILTPSFMRSIDPKHLPSLRALMLGGEPTQPSDLAAWSPYMKLMMGYGPAKCGSTHLRSYSESPDDPYTSVGFLTGGANWLVAPGDPEKLLPIGAVGELLLEGPFVGQGYMHNAAKTQEVFLAEPSYVRKLRNGPSRVYKTGDLMRYNVDGSLSFVGRMDSQVKIRGQRIELTDVKLISRSASPLLSRSWSSWSRRKAVEHLSSQLSSSPPLKASGVPIRTRKRRMQAAMSSTNRKKDLKSMQPRLSFCFVIDYLAS